MSTNVTASIPSADEIKARALSLLLMQVIIVLGNVLVLVSCKTLKTWTVPDILIGSLALVDLINGLGPVLISVSMYFVHPLGFNGVSANGLCYCYVWMSSTLRLLGCFIASLMSIDRLFAIVMPLKYKVYLTNTKALVVIGALVTVASIIATLPLLGVSAILAFGPVCSFDFSSNYGLFIAILGYLQLLFVILCYIGVIKGIVGFLSRQQTMKQTQLRASVAYSGKSSVRKVTQTSRLSNRVSPQLGAIPSDNESPQTSRVPEDLISSNHTWSRASREQATVYQEVDNEYTPSPTLQLKRETSKKKSSVTFSPHTITHQFKANSALLVNDSSPNRGQDNRKRARTLSVRNSSDQTFNLIDSRGNGTFTTLTVTARMSPVDTNSSCTQNSLQQKTDVILPEQPKQKSFQFVDHEVKESLQKFKKSSVAWRNSRKLALVMGVVVLLFYFSWMPIVLCITISLLTGKNSAALQFISARMSLFSSMMNAFVYGIMLKQYRAAYIRMFKLIFFCCTKQRVHPNGS